jgi:hypothetical protein
MAQFLLMKTETKSAVNLNFNLISLTIYLKPPGEIKNSTPNPNIIENIIPFPFSIFTI